MPVIFLRVEYWMQFEFPALEKVQKNWKGSEEGREGHAEARDDGSHLWNYPDSSV